MAEADELVVVRVDEPDPDPVVVLATPPTLGDVAVVVVDDAPPADRGATLLDELRDVDTAGASTGHVLTRGDDGVWRPKPLPATAVTWGDSVAFSTTRPDPDTAPEGAVWVELTDTLKLWRRHG